MIRYSPVPNTPAIAAFNRIVRIFVVYDNSPDVVPDADDILSVDNINGVMDLGNADRFMVLVDHYIKWTDEGSTGKIYKKFNLEQLYNAGGVNLTQGQIWLFTCHNSSVAGDPMSYVTRVRYTDA